MSKENGFIPIDEVNTERVHFSVDLPSFIDRTSIRTNPERLESLMNLGGISYLRVETFEGNSVSEAPMIVGYDSQGNAYAGKAGSSAKEPEKIDHRDERSNSCSPTRHLIVRVDAKHINDKFSNDLRSASGWGNELDKASRKGLRETANKVLIVDNLAHDSGYLIIYALFQGVKSLYGVDLTDLAYSYGSFSAFMAVFYQLPILRKHRLSFTLGPQLDRAVLMNVRTRFQKVIEGIDTRDKL